MMKEMMKEEKDEKKRRSDGEAKTQLNILLLLTQCISHIDSRPCSRRTSPKQHQSARQIQSAAAAAAVAAAMGG
jgi:hypothetical protein